nr:hypothetical protein [Variovorax sp. Sphag1AA]
MLKHAAEAIATGQAEKILVCAGENRATRQSRDAAVAALMAVGHPYYEQPYGASIPSFYAMIVNRHMHVHVHGTTREQMAQVAVNTRAHALLHPNAHMKKPLWLQEVLEAKPIADPVGMLDCCLISDAGGAFIVTSTERAADLKACLPAGHRRVPHARASDVRAEPDRVRRHRIGSHRRPDGRTRSTRYRCRRVVRLFHDRADH